MQATETVHEDSSMDWITVCERCENQLIVHANKFHIPVVDVEVPDSLRLALPGDKKKEA